MGWVGATKVVGRASLSHRGWGRAGQGRAGQGRCSAGDGGSEVEYEVIIQRENGLKKDEQPAKEKKKKERERERERVKEVGEDKNHQPCVLTLEQWAKMRGRERERERERV
jgi:hypothetical protein